MVTLKNIELAWAHDDVYNNENLCRGQILIDENGWFEGVVIERNINGIEHFVFGVFRQDIGIEVYEIDGFNVPFRFVAVQTPYDEAFTGAIYAITQMNNIDGIDLEKAKVVISPSDISLIEKGKRVKELRLKIDSYKEDEIPHVYAELYDTVKGCMNTKLYDLEALRLVEITAKKKTMSPLPTTDK